MGRTRFTFASGNIGKLARLPLYVLAKPAQWLVPRSRKQWVFGSGAGVAQGAWELWGEVAKAEPDSRLTWLVANEDQAEEAREAGIDAVDAQSLAGFWRTLRAGVVVVTHGLGDANRYGSGGSFLVQLWHGIPLKKIHLDSPATFALGARMPAIVGTLLRRLYLRSTRAISLFPVPSELVAGRIRTAFGLEPSRVVVTGDPRDEVLLRGTPASRAAASRRVLAGAGVVSGLDDGRRLVLFAPTWRDGQEDPGVPSEAERDALQLLAQELDLLILVRPHPLGVGAYRAAIEGADRLRMVGSESVPDVNTVLSAVDALVTDYSSVALDYSLRGGHIVWFAPDEAAYSKSRGLYEDYSLTTGGHEESWAQVAQRLREVLGGGPAASAQASPDGGVAVEGASEAAAASLECTRALRDRFFDIIEPGAPARVYAQILSRRRAGGLSSSGRRAALGSNPPASGAGEPRPVFFESFYGRTANDNPGGIDAALARLRPEITRYWGIERPGIQVPEGAVAVVQGTPEFASARAAAGLLVVNDWLRAPARRKEGQRVLQTWHGTPLKNLALGRPNVSLRTRVAIHRQSRRWDALLSQNPYSTVRLSADYAFRGPVWELGYPRNDVLSTVSKAQARAALGLDPQGKVALYAPTWRDDGRIVLGGAGLGRLASELGEEWTLLVRAHSRVAEGLGEAGERVVDVSQVGELGLLLLAADVLVTDYSSIMFDAASTGIPMVFYAPDLELYRDQQRGFGLDFSARAPGPMPTDADGLLASIRGAGEPAQVAEYARRYAAWAEDFTPLDDGDAGERVVRRLEAEGFLG